MYILGIDVSKETLVCVLIDKSFKVKKAYSLINNLDSIEKLLDEVSTKHKHLIVGCEATSEYHLNLAKSCINKGIIFKLLNPITTKQYTRATVRKKKTDLSDAHVIAMLLSRGEGTVCSLSHFSHTKPTTRTATKLAQVKQQLYLISKRLDNLGFNDQLKQDLNETIERLDKTILVFREEAVLKTSQDQINLLKSIPGIGDTLAVIILSEIGDLNRFKSSDSLIAFSGLDPKVKQSGKALHHNTKLTKRGSPYLRKALYMASSIAAIYDPQLKQYHTKKKGEGKYYKEATCATARKLTCRIYAVLKRQTPYVVRDV